MNLHIKDVVELKKTHPCGSKQWEITRVGMDIKLKCLGCGHGLRSIIAHCETARPKSTPEASHNVKLRVESTRP